jgi:hypothetical protein
VTVSARSRIFCSDAARLRGDDNTATAARIDVWILVELPRTWGRDPLADAGLPPDVRDALERALDDIPRSRVVFIRRRLECTSGARLYIARTTPVAGLAMLELPSLEDVATVPFASIAREELPPAPLPLILVCTHGQHDSCCGRRGYPVYDALRERDDVDVWQCSHIGGDRFAANAVVLPWGIFYGPVEPRDAAALADAAVRNEILLPSYRGRSSMSRPVQAAETFIRRATNILDRDALRFLSRESLYDGRIRVLFEDDAARIHDVTIEHATNPEPRLLTCSARELSPLPQFRLISYQAPADRPA